MTEKLIRVTIEVDGEAHVYEGHTIVGGIVQLPKDAPLQAIIPFSHGRVSVGDWCSMIVTSVAMAKQACEDRGLPEHLYLPIIVRAIDEGLGLKDE